MQNFRRVMIDRVGFDDAKISFGCHELSRFIRSCGSWLSRSCRSNGLELIGGLLSSNVDVRSCRRFDGFLGSNMDSGFNVSHRIIVKNKSILVKIVRSSI